MSKKKLIIDCDAGLDDAMAILMAASSDEVEVLAITCVRGNTSVDNVVRNVKRTLEVSRFKQKPPVYAGSDSPLLGTFSYVDEIKYHGLDGFGDVEDWKSDPTIDEKDPEEEHAVLALTRLVQQFPGEISIACLGPLTNIALAIRMNPQFNKLVKSLHIMGGNVHGHGNSTMCAEFNFIGDPEAAYIVLNEMKCPMIIVPWETCIENVTSWKWRDDTLSSGSTASEFIRRIEAKAVDRYHGGEKGFGSEDYILCDQFATATVLDPEVVMCSEDHYVSVELNGTFTKGMMVLDRNNTCKQKPNAKIVRQVDMARFKKMIENVFL